MEKVENNNASRTVDTTSRGGQSEHVTTLQNRQLRVKYKKSNTLKTHKKR